MKVPLKWLREYVNIDGDIQDFTEKMTMSGTKVEGYVSVGEGIENVVIGKIVQIRKHPDADKLVVTKVDVGNAQIQIVTGASNVSVGDIIPVALHGASLPSGTKIKKGKLRGEVSEGMLCSAKELGIDEKYVAEESKDGIWLLRDTDYRLGQDIREALLLSDYIVEFELTPNRPDCQSMLGIAYEAAATFDKEVQLPKTAYSPVAEQISWHVEVDEEKLCPRYAIREIKNVQVKPSPYKVQRKLIEAGIRPINNIVDITNYVMLEYGQPLHAFDADQLKTKEIRLKRARDGQKFTTLDEEERTLDSSMLLITDGGEPIAIAGVMGGLNSEVSEGTTHVLLEAANFAADSIRQTSKKLGLRTEASARFEKGIDLKRVEQAMDRACHLIAECSYGQIAAGKVDTFSEEIKEKVVSVRMERINRMIGEELPAEEIIHLLKKLNFSCELSEGLLSVTLPSFRQDIHMEADIVEEVARLYGYNKIQSAPITGEMTAGKKTADREVEDIIKFAMMANGLMEIMTYSFVSPKSLEKIGADLRSAVSIRNPLGQETSVMRTSLIPAMLETMSRNIAKKVEFFSAFELGNIFLISKDGQPVQKRAMVAGVYGGKQDFFAMKSRLEGVLEIVGIKKHTYIPCTDNPIYHTRRCAAIELQGQVLGYIGEVHPAIAESFDMKKRLYLFELDFEQLSEYRIQSRRYRPVAKFPAIERDIAIIVSDEVFVRDIENILYGEGGELVESAELFDVYRGEQVPQGKKSVAYSIRYRAKDRTLKDEEVNRIQERILRGLDQKLQAKIREI